MTNRVIFNDVASSLKTQAYGGEANIPINLDTNGNLFVTGVVNVTNVNPITVTGTVGLQENTVVGITGPATFILGGHSTTQINRTFNVTVPPNTVISVTTTAIDISIMGRYSYYVKPDSHSVTVQTQIAPSSDTALFINTSDSEVSITSSGGIISESDFLKYSRLKCTLHGDTVLSYSVTVQVILQGQY